ncbi:hypothetical protein NA57DRAFT_50886 [Rhizodiscina lignyota]|uniref:Mitochondrial import inner membrane translocase subunit n=1 Tax=Rhizodiscina lignyota TaxID=1504668 RepID=A0A9P4ME20_9PEZI|nr:hypothetical protein NA57DRAFT_50886 [Rhizodiscina lignyota]
MESLNAQEQRELQSRMEKKQLKEFANVCASMAPKPPLVHQYMPFMLADIGTVAQMYSNMVQRCFDDCINDFSSKSIGSKEESCVMRCVDKQLKSSERLGLRFQEQNATMMGPGAMPGR